MGSRGFRRTAAKYATLVIAGFLSMALMACQNSSGSTNSNLTTIDQNLRFQSVDGIAPSIPQYMMVTVPATFALNASGSVTVSNATWNFGDGTTANTAIATHTYSATGTYTVTVTATDSNGNQMSFNQAVTVVAFNEAYNCIADLSTSVPSVGTVGQAVTMTLNVPSCMTGEITTTDWNFGDNSTGSGTSVTHTFTTAGVYTVNTAIYIFDGTTPSFTVTATISITGGNSTSGGGSTSGSGSGSTSGSGTGSTAGSGSGSTSGSGTGSTSGSGTGSTSGSGTGSTSGSGTGSTPPPNGTYCECVHHYHWDNDFSEGATSEMALEHNNSDSNGDYHHDWGHDCRDWFDDHLGWFEEYGTWFKDGRENDSDTSRDHVRCEDHGHHNWDQDCADYNLHGDDGNH